MNSACAKVPLRGTLVRGVPRPRAAGRGGWSVLPQDRAAFLLQSGQDALYVSVRLLSGEAPVIGPEGQVEGHALLTGSNARAGVDVKQGRVLQKALSALADGVLQFANGDGCVAYHGDVAGDGGDMNIAGIKWAAESKKNATTPGIPYGIDISILSDPVTVLPFCIQDGTIITAMRTSAVAGLQAKYCAPSDTDTATLIGAGVIGRTMIMAICEAIPTVKTIYLCDLDLEKAQQVAKESEGKYGVTIIPTSDSKAAAAKSQLIVGETTARTPFIDKSWVKPHSAIVCVSNEATTDVVKAADVNVVDYWKQIITFKNKAITQVFDAGEITKEEVLETSDLVLGKPCRTSDEQFIYACSLGLGALDITVAYALYQNAVKLGLGTKVKLWDKPLWE